jgi:uncharacterized membrane protein
MHMIRETLAAYQPYQWLMFFFLYNFVGWIYETAFVSIKNRHFENRGFLWGPQIPLYGSGALLMLFLALPVKDDPVLCFLVGMAGATALEFVVGILMESIFKVKYWDYSNIKTNIKGVICLPASLLWGAFTIVLVNWLHRPVEAFVLAMSAPVVILLDVLFGVCFVTDFAMSLKAALELRDMLEALTKLRAELGKVQDQLAEYSEQLKEELADRAESVAAGLEEKFTSAMEALPEGVQASVREGLEELREIRQQRRVEKQKKQEERAAALQQLKEKAADYVQQLNVLNTSRRKMRDNLLTRHTGIRSERFGAALKEAREHLPERPRLKKKKD